MTANRVVRLSEAIPAFPQPAAERQAFLVGVLDGEGIGPEVVGASLRILETLETHTPLRFDIRRGGKIGKDALRQSGASLTPAVISFCEQVFADGGALVCGPGGARFVYDLRRRFDLFCKFVPLLPVPALRDTGALRPEAVTDVDIVVVRENVSGLYFGETALSGEPGQRVASHRFQYREAEVDRIIAVACRAAQLRRGKLCVILKPGAVSSVSDLWQQRAEALTQGSDIELRCLEVDNAAYQLVADARAFDVVVAPNMFGDVLADGASVLLASRGMSLSANFGSRGRAVYQTGHGAAYDLAGLDKANPLGQIASLAMMLHESFGLSRYAAHLQSAMNEVLAAGWRTADILAPGCRLVGCRELADRVNDAFRERLN